MKTDYSKIQEKFLNEVAVMALIVNVQSLNELTAIGCHIEYNPIVDDQSLNDLSSMIAKRSDKLFEQSFYEDDETESKQLLKVSERLAYLGNELSKFTQYYSQHEDSDVNPKHFFRDRNEAMGYVNSLADDPCTDNFRLGYLDDSQSMRMYEDQQGAGCCGSIDILCKIGDKFAMAGCNYGH